MADQTYYQLLGVKQDASTDEIKRAFKKLARKHHPDAGGDETVFKEISNAFDVLSDKDKRAEYDDMLRYGAFFSGGGAHGYRTGAGGAYGPNTGNWRTVINDFGNLGDMFGRIRSGEGVFGTNWDFPGQPAKGRDTQVSLDISFAEAFNGGEKRVTIRSGDGKEQVIDVKIPAGAVDGGKLRFKGKGYPGNDGGEPGDLVIVTRIKKHSLYRRKGADVLMTLPVSISEAALGAQVVVPTPDGSMVRLRIPAGTVSGKVLLVRGKGAPRVKGEGFGDLKVEVLLTLPSQLNPEQIMALEAFAKASGDLAADIRPEIAAATSAATNANTTAKNIIDETQVADKTRPGAYPHENDTSESEHLR
ncbi:MAG: J domain-containing protein [Coriobacteriales bacterium]|jgi:curved DNA-binding protein|nr:J domain-containing protein [Coriobacteriales bacterium]